MTQFLFTYWLERHAYTETINPTYTMKVFCHTQTLISLGTVCGGTLVLAWVIFFIVVVTKTMSQFCPIRLVN